MKYEIKQINDSKRVVISNEDIKDGDITLDGNDLFSPYEKGDIPVVKFEKIIATISPYQIEGLPMFKLSNQEEDFTLLNKVIEEESEIAYLQTGSLTSIEIVKRAASAGYKAAQKQYSKDDMKKAIEMAREGKLSFKFDNEGIVYKYTQEEIIQSLQKKQFPTSVELTENFKPLKWYYE